MNVNFKSKYGPWALVTGASEGIGKEITFRLAEAGINVVLVARRGDLLLTLAQELQNQHAVSTKTIVADLATDEGVHQVTEQTKQIDIGLLVAAAGFGTSGNFVGATLHRELQMIDVNCKAVAALSHAFGNRFIQRRKGGIVLLSSLVAFQGVPRAANYAATKAYIQSFAEALRLELRPLGVDVIAAAPGPIHSGFAAQASMTMGFAQTPHDVAGATLAALGHQGTIRPGWLSKLLEYSLKTLPRWGRVRMMGIIMAGMTKRPVLPLSSHRP